MPSPLPLFAHRCRRRRLLLTMLFVVGAPLFACASAFSATATDAASATSTTFEHRLANGLQVIVREDHRAPTAAHMVWYRVGSMDEVSGTTGVAHALEHMMFKGTPKVGMGELSKRVAAAGGRDNAFTSHDFTAYFEQVPAEKLGEMMALEADRMRHLNLDAKEFAKEIEVIKEERRMSTEDSPAAVLYEQVEAAAFVAHPYRWPIIGWMGDLDHMTVTDLRAWYDRWYEPNNATVVVVGDVDHRDVFKLAQKFYGALPARPLPPRKALAEPEQRGNRRVSVKGPAELPVLLLAWKAPVLVDVHKDNDPYALDMLTYVLFGHEGARLPTHLVREQRLAQNVAGGYEDLQRGPGLFLIEAVPAAGHSVAELEAAIKAEIKQVAEQGVRAEELQRAKAQLLAGQVYKRDSMFGQAMEIGQLAVLGRSWRDSEVTTARLQAVTPADVQRVAAAYLLNDDTLTVGVLDPQPLDRAAPPAAPPVHQH